MLNPEGVRLPDGVPSTGSVPLRFATSGPPYVCSTFNACHFATESHSAIARPRCALSRSVSVVNAPCLISVEMATAHSFAPARSASCIGLRTHTRI